jgi:hypothetical protein
MTATCSILDAVIAVVGQRFGPAEEYLDTGIEQVAAGLG